MTKPTLWVVGDSFSQPREEYNGTNALTWPELVADMLGCDLVNQSWYGVSQDYCWLHLQVLIHENKIKPEDYVIVVMTHPNRFWYIEDQPDLSNAVWTVNIDEYVTPEQAAAITGYVQHIQRPELDILHQISRMGWLAYARVLRNLRRPLVIKAFSFDLLAAETYTDLNIAHGNLFEIQTRELPATKNTLDVTTYFNGADPRYNHLTLPNHKILAKAVSDSLKSDTQLDLLTVPFLTKCLPEKLDENTDASQFNPTLWEHYLNMRKTRKITTNGLTGWLKGVKVIK